MDVRRRCHAGGKYGFHVLDRVRFGCIYREWADFGNAFTAARSPTLVFDSEQPNFAQGLDNRSASSLCSLCVSSRRVDIQVPKHLGFSQLAERVICHDPASELTCTLTNRLAAGALRNVLGACLSSAERPRDGYQRYQ
jgi:hypothetical protein